MNYCTYLRKRKNKPYCYLIKKEITFSQCQECVSKEYKMHNKSEKRVHKKVKMHSKKNYIVQNNNIKRKSRKIRSKSYKLAKLERNRFSVFSNNKEKCFLCENTTNLTWHEIYRGRNRTNSMKFGFCLRLCLNCHEKYQDDDKFNELWHKQAQLYFENYIGTREDFISIFRKNYLEIKKEEKDI